MGEKGTVELVEQTPQTGIEPIPSSAVKPVTPAQASKGSPFEIGRPVTYAETVVWLMDLGPMTYPSPSKYWNMEDALEVAMICRDLASAACYGVLGKTGVHPIMMQKQFAPVSKALIEMTKGSIETHLQNVRRLIKEEQSKFGGTTALPVATFQNSALVVNDKKELYKVMFEYNEMTGQLYLSSIEKLNIPVQETTREQQAVLFADRVVESLVKKDRQSAGKQLFEFLEIIDGTPAAVVAMKYKTVAERIDRDRYWKKYVNENKYQVKKFLHGQISEIKELVPKEKFQEAYSGAPKDKVEIYRKELVDSLRVVNKNIDKLAERVREQIHEAEQAIDRHEFKDLDLDANLTELRRFVDEYAEDLEFIKEAVDKVLKEGEVPDMALIHDTVARNYESIEMAGRLISKLFESLKAKLKEVR